MSESNNPGDAGRVDEPGPYELHERVDQELLRESQARAKARAKAQAAGTSGVELVSPEEYLRRTPERNAYREELRGSAGLVDARRTVEKAEAVLRHVAVYFDRKDSMNAAQHLSDRVIQSPLHSEVLSVLAAIDLFKQGQDA